MGRCESYTKGNDIIERIYSWPHSQHREKEKSKGGCEYQ